MHGRRIRRPGVVAATAMILLGGVTAVTTTAAVAATVDTSAWYVLLNRNSGKALDVTGASTADGAKLVQWSRTTATNQQFQFVDADAGYYKVRARHSGKVLDVSGRSTADGAAVVQWPDNNGTNQQFSLADSGTGFLRLVNRNSGKAVEVQGASTADGAAVDQRGDANDTSQQWQLVQVDGGSTPLPPASGPRQKVGFDREWKFARSDVPGAQNPGFDDSAWVPVALPHDFDAPYDVGGAKGGDSFYVGAGWYRKHFTVPASWTGKRVEFESEGAFSVTDVWVNGTKAGTHRGGYTGFTFDITGSIRPGDNEMSVRVDNSWRPDLAPRTGDHQFSGGLYRDVFLNVTNDVHVTWYGAAVTTPALTNPGWDTSNPAYYRNIDLAQYPSEPELRANIAARRSNVRVQTEVRNDGPAPVDVHARHEVRKQGSNTVLATFDSPARTLGAASTTTLDAVSGSLSDTAGMLQNLDLWAPDNPALYTVTTSLVAGDTVVDSYDSTFGFRSAQWKVDGFYLNGAKTLLVGADVHQDHGGWSNAVTDSGFERDVRYIREAGMNFIRGSHYPHDPSFADATDELGVMFWSENTFWATATAGQEPAPTGSPGDYRADGYPQKAADQPGFEQSAKDGLRDMIRVNRNHPSIVNWSMGNEVFFTSSATLNKAKALVSSLRDYSHQLDPTRKAAMGGVQRASLDQLSICDVAGYNGDGGKIINTWMPNVVSEYGSSTSDRPGTYDPTYGDLKDPSDGTRFRLTPGSAGLAIWAGFDHGTILGASLARMGMIDYYRLPKDQWYWYRANKTRWSGTTTIADPTPVAREQSVNGTATGMTLQAGKYSSTTITDDGTTDTQLVVTMRNAAGA